MTERRKRKEFAPTPVENSVSDEKLAAFIAARDKALAEKAKRDAAQADDAGEQK